MISSIEQPRGAVSPAYGFWPVVAVGGLLGYYIAGDITVAPHYHLLAALAQGLAWAYLALQWADMIGEALAFRRDPIPTALDIGDREAVKSHLEGLKGRQHLDWRVRNLLQSWCLGANARQIIDLAAFQSSHAGAPVRAGAVFVILFLISAATLGGGALLTWGGLMLLALTIFTRQSLLNRTDYYMENRLLSRMPGNIPQTAMTAKDLAAALGGAIKEAFRESVPQPERTAAAMKEGVQDVVSKVTQEVEKLQKVLVDSQSLLVDKWMHAAKATTTDLKDVESALSTIVNDLTGGLSTTAEKLNTMFSGHTKEMEKSLSSLSSQIKDGVGASADKLHAALEGYSERLDKAVGDMGRQMSAGDWSTKLKEVLAGHSASIEGATSELSDQLQKVGELQKDIEKVLHVQEVVDGTLKTVAASQEFGNLVSALREHLEASDKLLREVSKPRTIKLIEEDGEIVAQS